jgi:hypothetical protein
MSYSPEPKAKSEPVYRSQETKIGGPLDVSGFYDALNKTEKEYSATSWGGFNLWGDRKSIDELHRLMWKESFIKPLHDRIENQQNIITELKEKLDEAERKAYELGQQLDDM